MGKTHHENRPQQRCFLQALGTGHGSRPDWTVERLAPYADHVLSEFGPGRVLWGSDWPVCTLAASYAEWTAVTGRLLDGCGNDERAAILGGNAIEVYGLGSPPAR